MSRISFPGHLGTLSRKDFNRNSTLERTFGELITAALTDFEGKKGSVRKFWPMKTIDLAFVAGIRGIPRNPAETESRPAGQTLGTVRTLSGLRS